MNKNQIQHGDVLIWRITKMPEGCKAVPRHNGLLVVAKGEATGHHHVIAEKGAVLYELRGELYLEVTEPVTITHEEHKPLSIPEGIYQIGRVKEYDYFRQMQRKVID
jgi:hypothetical protein